MNWQVIKDLAYSRHKKIVAYGHWPFIALSIWWMIVVGDWVVHPTRLSALGSLFAQMTVLPVLYLIYILTYYKYIWQDRNVCRHRYRLWVTDPSFETMLGWMLGMGWQRGREFTLGLGDWGGEPRLPNGRKWRYEVLFERADQWMLAKMKF